MSSAVFDWLAGIGGVGGILALVVFCSYMTQVKQMREDRKYMEDRMTGLLKDYNEACEKHADATNRNTQALSELTTYLRTKNGH